MTVAHILASFAYFAKTDLGRLVDRARVRHGVTVDFFADSGAFSAYTSGKTITVKQYAAWLTLHAPLINCAATLDVIGDSAASATNTAALQEAVGDRVYIIPIFHAGSPWKELERLCATHPYIGLGGGVAVGRRRDAFMSWLVHCHKIGEAHGAVFHGFGMTRPPYPDKLPFYSVDSSFWSSASRTGTVTLFDRDRRRFVCLRHNHDINLAIKRDPGLVRSYGGDPRVLGERGFALVGKRADRDQALAERAWLSESAVESWMHYGEHLRDRHRAVAAPAPVTGDGPKIYLSAGSKDDFDLIARVAGTRIAAVECV